MMINDDKWWQMISDIRLFYFKTGGTVNPTKICRGLTLFICWMNETRKPFVELNRSNWTIAKNSYFEICYDVLWYFMMYKLCVYIYIYWYTLWCLLRLYYLQSSGNGCCAGEGLWRGLQAQIWLFGRLVHIITADSDRQVASSFSLICLLAVVVTKLGTPFTFCSFLHQQTCLCVGRLQWLNCSPKCTNTAKPDAKGWHLYNIFMVTKQLMMLQLSYSNHGD